MTITRCQACLGSKKVLGLGCMQVDCHECKGIGHVELKPTVSEISVTLHNGFNNSSSNITIDSDECLKLSDSLEGKEQKPQINNRGKSKSRGRPKKYVQVSTTSSN